MTIHFVTIAKLCSTGEHLVAYNILQIDLDRSHLHSTHVELKTLHRSNTELIAENRPKPNA